MPKPPKNKISIHELAIMNRDVIRELARQHQISRLACYKIQETEATLILDTNDDKTTHWPAIIACDDYYYTLNAHTQLTFGWQTTPSKIIQKNPELRNVKSYLPPQDLWSTKLLFLLKKDGRSIGEIAALDGFLEALARRFHFWLANDELRHFIDDTASQEQLHSFGAMISRLISHEIRNPITNLLSIAQEQILLATSDESVAFASDIERFARQIWDVILKLEIVATDQEEHIAPTEIPKPIDLREIIESECARELKAADSAHPPKLRIHITDGDFIVHGVVPLLRLAIREVIRNAISYANGTLINVSLYANVNHFILDIQDEGVPISPGQEELMFLRYYQGPKSANFGNTVKRGLGLGLHLARTVTNFHNGQLLFVRNLGKKGTFRFIWPRFNDINKAS